MPLIIVHPHPAKRRSFNYAAPVITEITKKISILGTKKVPFNYAPPPVGEATSLQLCRCELIWGVYIMPSKRKYIKRNKVLEMVRTNHISPEKNYKYKFFGDMNFDEIY